MRRILLTATAALLAGCFNPASPTCTYACGDGGTCPDDYTCNSSDHYCHRNDRMAEACGFSDAAVSPDLAVDASVPDLAVTIDLADEDIGESVDMQPDLFVPDLSTPDLATDDM